MTFGNRGKQGGEGPVCVRSGHYVNLARIQERVLEAFGHASEDTDHDAPAGLPVLVELLYTAPDALFGIVPDGTGVGHYDVRFRYVEGAFVTFLSQNSKNDLGVVDVHLASVSFDVELFHCSRKDRYFSYLCRNMNTSRKIGFILAAVLTLLLSQACDTEKYKQVKCLSYDLVSFEPVSMRNFEAVVKLQLDNPAPAFKIKNIKAVVKRKGEGLLTVLADPLNLEGKCVADYEVPLHGELAEDLSALQLVSMFHRFNPDDYTIDVNARANVFGSIGKDVEYKDLPVSKFLGKEDNKEAKEDKEQKEQ